MSVLKCHFGTLPNEHDGISDIAFLSPLMYCRVSGQQLLAFSQSASAQIKWLVFIDYFAASLSTHPTVGELLLNNTVFFSCSGLHTFSMMTYNINSPAISRLEFDIVPKGLWCDTNVLQTSSGQSNQNTVGVKGGFLPMITPPTLWLDVSFMPTKSGHPPTSLRQRVEAVVDSCNSVCMPSIAKQRSLLQCRYTWVGCNHRIALHSNINPFPAGFDVNAWRNFNITDWNLSKGIPKLHLRLNQSHPWRMVSNLSLLLSSS